MGESPRWHDGRLWVCDWVAGEVLSFDATGERRVELTMTGLPFSVDWLPDGRTVLTSTEGVVTADADGTLTPYGATGQGWNEIVVDPAGNTFVNAAGFDLMGGEEPKPGFVWVVRPDGSSEQVADDVWFPNGMAVTADGRTLIVAESYGHCLTAFDIDDDGTSLAGVSGRTSARPTPTASASTPRAPSGTPTSRTGAASASPRAARCSRSWRPTGAASPACSAVTTAARSTWSRRSGAAPAASVRGSRPARC